MLKDRSFYLVGAQPKDPDEGLSEGEDHEDSVAGQMQQSRAGKSDEDLSDVDEEILEGMDKDDEDEGGKADDQEDEVRQAKDDLDEEEETYRKRFADTKADRDEKIKQLREMMAENAKLKALSTLESDVNEEELARQIQEGIYADISAIHEKDPNKARKAAYDVVGRHIAKATKQAVDLALKTVKGSVERERQQVEQQTEAANRATKMAKIALKENGLDPDKHFGMFQKEVDRQMEEDPDWFQAIPPNQHYVRLVDRVKERMASNKKANDDHQREARGQVNSGARVSTRQPQDDQQDDDGADSLKGAMALARKASLLRSKRMFSLAARR